MMEPEAKVSGGKSLRMNSQHSSTTNHTLLVWRTQARTRMARNSLSQLKRFITLCGLDDDGAPADTRS